MRITQIKSVLTIACLLLAQSFCSAAIPYAFPGPAVIGAPGPGIPDPGTVIGKEFSDFLDRDTTPALDGGQVISWDGVGGVVDGVDYSGVLPVGAFAAEVDALAHRNDLLFDSLRADTSALLFSAGNGTSPVVTGTLTTTEGETIGYSGDINYEVAGSTTKGVWASAAMVDGMSLPFDVDGLEIWGPEPPGSDADRFSLLADAASGVSVWTGAGAPYIAHSDIVAAVTSLLGPLPSNISNFEIDLDALISSGDDDDWAPGDSIIFSIRQISDPSDLVDGFYATGSEIFTLDNTATALVPGYLTHGGHDWDHAYGLAAMKEVVSGRQLDINAIEGVSVPEPTGILLISSFLSLFAMRANRRRASR